MSDVAVKVQNVSKTFKLPHEKTTSIKGIVTNFYRRKKTFERQQVLKDVSLEIKKGEFFGIVGRNGSGKSTLLKILAGIYAPTSGSISIEGRLTPFIELGVGFNPELTGRENVFLNGALLGFNRKEMTAMYDDIVSFAEIERFMDQKLKNYSSGMQVRLAFSIAIRANSDVLILDEVLAVGDERFQDKCIAVFEDLKKSGKTIILVTHDMRSVKRFCQRAAVIDNSELKFVGEAVDAAAIYAELNFGDSKDSNSDASSIKATLGDGKVAKQVFANGEKMVLDISWKDNKRAKNVGVALISEAGHYIYGTNTIIDGKPATKPGIRYELGANLGEGNYYLQVGVFGDNDSQKIYYSEHAAHFKIVNNEQWQGLTKLNHKWVV